MKRRWYESRRNTDTQVGEGKLDQVTLKGHEGGRTIGAAIAGMNGERSRARSPKPVKTTPRNLSRRKLSPSHPGAHAGTASTPPSCGNPPPISLRNFLFSVGLVFGT